MLKMPQKQTLFVQFIAITERPIVDKAVEKETITCSRSEADLNRFPGWAMVFVLFVVTKL